MRILTVLILLFSLIINSCLKLNDVPFLGEKIDQYLFDDYGMWNGFILNESYNIPDSNIHLFTLNSQLDREHSPTKIYAAFIGNMNSITSDTIILYLHGQSKHMDYYWQRTKLLANLGSKNQFGVLTMDYRGYGLSEGKSTEETLYEDVRTCLDWLEDKGVSSSRVIIYGYSFGCIPGIDMCAYHSDYFPEKLIIEAPLASVQNLTEESFILNIDKDFMTSLEFNNAEKIKDVHQPLMWIHGSEDKYIKISNGQLIYNNHNGVSKQAHIAQNAEHSNIPETFGLDNYLDRVLNFISQ